MLDGIYMLPNRCKIALQLQTTCLLFKLGKSGECCASFIYHFVMQKLSQKTLAEIRWYLIGQNCHVATL